MIIRGLTGSRDAAGEEIDLESTPSNVAEQRAGSARPSTGAAPSGDRTEAPARSSDADVATRETRADTSSADERVPSPPADPRGPAVVPGSMQAAAEAYHAGDYREAERIWRRLAEAGSPPAQFALGALLYEGRTGPVDRVEAYEWLTRAVERGHEPASRLREQVRDEMTGDELRAVEGASG